MPSAKIILNLNNGLITNGQIINFDFFDDMHTYVLPISEIVEKVKREILKKGDV